MSNEISKLKSENLQLSNLAAKSSELEKENSELKAYISALKAKCNNPELLNFNDYEEGPIIREGATSTVS